MAFIMTFPRFANRVREHRVARGLSQAALAAAAGVSRTAVTGIESGKTSPSVDAALRIAASLDAPVETLFGRAGTTVARGPTWAWPPTDPGGPHWEADVAGQTVSYPATTAPMLAFRADEAAGVRRDDTLVIATCDPAAGLLAAEYAASTPFRLLVIPRSSRASLAMAADGLIHAAGIHLTAAALPDGNAAAAREALGTGVSLLRMADWEEGIASAPHTRLRSSTAARRRRIAWVGREPGSGARACLDRLLDGRPPPRRQARDHRGVSEAIASGWAEAGICVRLAAAEAGLDFIAVEREAYDLAIPAPLVDDRRVRALVTILRGRAWRRRLGGLPGYDVSRTGSLRSVR